MSTHHEHEDRTDGENTSGLQHPAYTPDLDTTPTSEVPQSVIAIKDPPSDPQPPNGSFITIASSQDYFTSDPTVDKRFLDDDDYSYPARPSTLPPLITQHSQAPVKASVKGSDAAVPGTIVVPGSTYRSRQSLSARPSSRRDTKHRFNHSMAEHSPPRHDEGDDGMSMSASGQLPPRPPYPNQAYAALHTQHHPVRNVPPVLRQRSSHPNHTLTLSGVAPFYQYHSGSRTVGNSPANTPSAGLYSPKSAPVRDEWESPETPGTYASPYLHPTHRQAPKETHVADVDVDPISGRKLINHYEIVDELGRGTHGKVKLGRDLETENNYVAIKIVERYSKRRRLGRLGNPEDKVKKEVAILKKARHPNVVALLEVIDDPTRKKVYIVLEWVSRGAIQWRAKAVREVAMLEARRYERERLGGDNEELLLKDKVLETEVQARLKKRRRERHSLFRAAMKERDPNRNIDHFGSNDLESDDDALSRVSTATNIAAAVEIAVQPDLTETNNDTPVEVPTTPTLGQPSLEINTSDMLNALSDQSAHEDVSSGTASPFEASEELRAWAAELLESELNPELAYVPCMTLQSIRVAFRDTLLGLQYLHYQGIVHRDIKPPNLLQTGEGRVKISDFGVSYLGRPIHDGDEPEAISESEAKDLDEEAKELAKTVGTPAFYAPELCITDHFEDHPPVTKAIDAWALGVTLFCMVFARTPFVDTEFVVMRQIADEEIYIPRRRLKPVDEEPKSRSSSRTRTYSPTVPDKRSELVLEYEEIDDDLHDLLKRLLTKDPRKRILLETVRHHPWTVADLPNKLKWLEETDLNRQTQNQKIEVSKEDLNTAVVPLQFLERMRSGIKKIGDRLLGSSARGRSTSSATSGITSQPVSAHSSSSTISQDARRRSLRGDEIFSALRASREAEQLQGQTPAADHERSNRAFFDEMPPTPAPYTTDFGAPLTQTVSHDSAARPALPGRSRTGASTTASIRTIRQSDFADYGRVSPPLSPGLPSTPRALDGSGMTNLSGLLGGSGRNVFKTIRERSQTRGSRPGSRATSVDRRSIGSADAYAEPSLAVSETNAAGRVEAPELLPVKTPGSSAANSVQHSPVALRPQSMVLPSDYRAGFSLSRHSSTSSVKSTGARPSHRDSTMSRPQPRSATTVSTAEEWRRADEERTRRLVQEARAPQKVTPIFHDRDCPPSPDDTRGRQPRDTRRISDFDMDRPSSSHETSPTTNSTHMLPSSLVSSTSDFGSAVSMTMSNPSIPSVISEASSVDAADGLPIEELEAKSTRPAGIRIPTRTLSSDKSVDEGYNPDMDVALDSDNDDSDADTDSDGGLTMSRRKSNTKLLLSSSPRLGSLSAAVEASRLKERRGTGLSKSSRKSSRSGSNNTMKKIRTRDSIDERRRPSFETSDAREY